MDAGGADEANGMAETELAPENAGIGAALGSREDLSTSVAIGFNTLFDLVSEDCFK